MPKFDTVDALQVETSRCANNTVQATVIAHQVAEKTRDSGMEEKKVAVITGGSRGIGRACAFELGRRGFRVMLVARNPAALQETASALLEEGIESRILAADVRERGAIQRGMEQVVAEWGRVDVLINNAGLHYRGDFLRQTPENVAEMIRVNLEAPIFLSRLLLPEILRHRGALIQVTSIAGCLPLPGSCAYSASKAGLRTFSKALAGEHAGSGARFACVSPGPVRTEFILDELEEVTDLTLSQPMVEPEEVARAVWACYLDGKPERKLPWRAGVLATMGGFFPGLRMVLRPRLERKGARQRKRLLAERERSNQGKRPSSSQGPHPD